MKGIKKAFTIVELVIVIAVIAILAAVLIPTFSGIIDKANQSNDIQLVKNLNTAISLEKQSQGNPNGTVATTHDAVLICESAGYLVDTIVAKSSLDIAWSVKDNCFVLVNTETGDVVYPSDEDMASASATGSEEKYFVFRTSMPDEGSADAKYSVYAGTGFEVGDEGLVEIKGVGFDAGYNTNIKKVAYTNDGGAKDVVIRTNSFETAVSVNGYVNDSDKTIGDVVTHYGQALSVEVIKVADASYDEKGEIKGNIIVTAGHLDLSEVEGAYIVIVKESGVKVTRNGNTIIIVAGEEGTIVEIDGTDVTTQNTDNKIYYLTLNANQIALSTKFSGAGTNELPFLLQNEDDYQTLAKETGDLSTYKFKQTNDITLTKDINLDRSVTINLGDSTLDVTKDSVISDNVKINGKVIKAGHTHIWANEWSFDSTNNKHYHACTVNDCTSKKDIADCSGGTATCQAKAVCEYCQSSYGNYGDHSFTSGIYVDNGDGTHSQKCAECSAIDTAEGHSYEGSVTYKSNGDGTHTKKCNFCDNYEATGTKHTLPKNASGYDRFKCTVCNDWVPGFYDDNGKIILDLTITNCKEDGSGIDALLKTTAAASYGGLYSFAASKGSKAGAFQFAVMNGNTGLNNVRFIAAAGDPGIERTDYARKVETIIFPEGMTSIPAGNDDYSCMFSSNSGNRCDKLKRIVLPSSITTINKNAFCYSYTIEDIIFVENKNNVTICDYAFRGIMRFGKSDGVQKYGNVYFGFTKASFGEQIFGYERPYNGNQTAIKFYYNGTQEEWNNNITSPDKYNYVDNEWAYDYQNSRSINGPVDIISVFNYKSE